MQGFAVNPRGEEISSRNAVMNGRLRRHSVDPFKGTLSIKTVLEGEAVWSTSHGRYRVTPESYLILNEGQEYRLDLDSPEPVETFCVFLRPGFLVDMRGGESDPGFYERLSTPSPGLSRAMRRLQTLRRENAHESLEAEDALIHLATALLRDHDLAVSQRDGLEHASLATREEVFRVLNRSRDCLVSSISESVSLRDLAQEAGFSPYHFHRLFRQAYGETPHQLQTRARMARATRLLGRGASVAATASDLGFASVPSFIRLFRAATGATPGRFRNIG